MAKIRKTAAFLSRPLIPFVVLPVLMVILVAGTIAQRFMTLPEAQALFFSFFPTGIVLGVLSLSLLCKFALYSPWTWARAGINLAHLGVLVLLIGGLVTGLVTQESTLAIPEGEARTQAIDHRTEQPITLPFSIYLAEFTETNYPGTMKPREYSSQIVVEDGGVKWPVLLEMNRPLRYRGYTFFQSSFNRLDDGTEETVLTVVHNESWLAPYLGTALMMAGLLWHTIVVMRTRRFP